MHLLLVIQVLLQLISLSFTCKQLSERSSVSIFTHSHSHSHSGLCQFLLLPLDQYSITEAQGINESQIGSVVMLGLCDTIWSCGKESDMARLKTYFRQLNMILKPLCDNATRSCPKRTQPVRNLFATNQRIFTRAGLVRKILQLLETSRLPRPQPLNDLMHYSVGFKPPNSQKMR